MKLMATSLVWRVNICVIPLATLVFIIGFADDHILTFDDGDGHTGLWKLCNYKNCYTIDDLRWYYDNAKFRDMVKASRVFLVTSLVAQFVVIGCQATVLAVTNARTNFIVGSCLSFVAVLMGIIGIAVFMGRFKAIVDVVDFSNGWGFVLIIAGLCAYLLSGLIQAFEARRLKDQPQAVVE